MKFGLSEKEYQMMDGHLAKVIRAEGGKVWCFGSRARNDHQKFSDIDILVDGTSSKIKPLIAQISEEFEESNFPYKVDIVFSEDVASSYMPGILKDRVDF